MTQEDKKKPSRSSYRALNKYVLGGYGKGEYDQGKERPGSIRQRKTGSVTTFAKEVRRGIDMDEEEQYGRSVAPGRNIQIASRIEKPRTKPDMNKGSHDS